MNLETFKQTGVRFDYCSDAVVPEIPRTQDVLYAMRLSAAQTCYDFCARNHAAYVANVGLAVAAVAYEVLGLERYDEAEARRIIARAILDLCPDEARCLFNAAFAEAKRLAGEDLPPEKTDREMLRAACGCPHCEQVLVKRNLAHDYHTA